MRTFETGATRDTEEGKLDFEAFLSPLVLEGFAKYMHEHRVQADGRLRSGDNWQKGMPLDVYMKSMWRHFFALWKSHRGHDTRAALMAAGYGVLFNLQGYLHEMEQDRAATEDRTALDCYGCDMDTQKYHNLGCPSRGYVPAA